MSKSIFRAPPPPPPAPAAGDPPAPAPAPEKDPIVTLNEIHTIVVAEAKANAEFRQSMTTWMQDMMDGKKPADPANPDAPPPPPAPKSAMTEDAVRNLSAVADRIFSSKP